MRNINSVNTIINSSNINSFQVYMIFCMFLNKDYPTKNIKRNYIFTSPIQRDVRVCNPSYHQNFLQFQTLTPSQNMVNINSIIFAAF